MNKSPEKRQVVSRVSGQLGVVKRVFHSVREMIVVLEPKAARIELYEGSTTTKAPK